MARLFQPNESTGDDEGVYPLDPDKGIYAFEEDMRTEKQKKKKPDIFFPDWKDECFRTTLLMEDPENQETYLIGPTNIKMTAMWLIGQGKAHMVNDLLDWMIESVDIENEVYN